MKRRTEFDFNKHKHIVEIFKCGEKEIRVDHFQKEVRDALVDNEIKFTLVYPEKELKDEYIERYVERGSPEGFINLLKDKWDEWIDEMDNQEGCKKIKLKQGQYLSDVIKK